MDWRSLLLLLLLFSLALQQLGFSHASSTSTVRCHASESDALMEFKRKLRDSNSGRFSSWVGQDCCGWEGVGCSNVTGHVIRLDLRNRQRLEFNGDCSDETSQFWRHDKYGCKGALFGDMSRSLLSLQHLRHLDLSGNFFQHNPIPEFLGSFRRLTYLNLSAAGFQGKVPDQLGNLSNLHHLDLSYNLHIDDEDTKYGDLYVQNAGWISRSTSLRHLSMDWVNFRYASNWLQAMNALPHIQVLRLQHCEIVSFPHNSLLHVNFTSLTTLDLSSNDIKSSVPNWLFNLTSLEHLVVGGNDLNWHDLASISKLTSLRELDLSHNMLQHGFVPAAFCNLCKLQTLFLSGMDINDEIKNLQVVFSGCLMLSLENLDLSVTRLRGYLPDWLWSMNNLKILYLSGNSLYGPIPAALGSLSSLQSLSISQNHFNGTIPKGVLGHMKELVGLFLGGNSLGLSEVHLATLSATLKYLDISSNTLVLNESYSNWIPPFQLEYLQMHSCRVLPRPQFPRWLQTQTILSFLKLSNMGIKGIFPSWLPTSIEQLHLSNNEITGQVPQYLSNLMHLHLSNNSFTGQLSSAINKIMPIIRVLDLSRNNFIGSIPFSICQIKPLFVLGLSLNTFSGKLPNCWKNYTRIKFLDFSCNKFHGGIPNSICNMRRLQSLHLSNNNFSGKLLNCWKNYTELIILDLSNNKFQGGIPNSFCNMQKLQSLHLSHNNLYGQIPICLKGCTDLIRVDLSYNRLVGNIPTWIEENLLYLYALNLRSNDFTGNISPYLSNLKYLQVLDLSNNKLSGVIPRNFGNFSALKGYPLYDDHSNFTIFSDGMWLYVKGSELEYDNLSSYARIIDLSNNYLFGNIPEEVENLKLLQSLNLSCNFLTGEIPRNIDGMQQLEVLHFSRNNLSGVIPWSLASLKFLSKLNLSYNNFSGRIPVGNQLQTFDQFSYISNPNLCGFPLPNNCAKDTNEEAPKEVNYEIIWLSASVASGFIIGFWTICGALIIQNRWRFVFFRVVDDMYDRLYVVIAVNIAKLRKE